MNACCCRRSGIAGGPSGLTLCRPHMAGEPAHRRQVSCRLIRDRWCSNADQRPSVSTTTEQPSNMADVANNVRPTVGCVRSHEQLLLRLTAVSSEHNNVIRSASAIFGSVGGSNVGTNIVLIKMLSTCISLSRQTYLFEFCIFTFKFLVKLRDEPINTRNLVS